MLSDRSPSLRMVYDYLRTHSSWVPVAPEDGLAGIPSMKRISIFGQPRAKFPLDLLINSIHFLPSTTLAQNLPLSLADDSPVDLSTSKTPEEYCSRWQDVMADTVKILRNYIDDGSKHWLEPPDLDALGMALNFVPVTRKGILSLLPPHNPHPLPPSSISPYTIIPSNSVLGNPKRPDNIIRMGSLFDPQQETPHMKFTITPPGMHAKFQHNRPIPCMNWGLVGFTLWLIFPCTIKNMEAWYTATEIDGIHTFQWAITHLANLSTCITGPGQRMQPHLGHFHSSISLTPVIRASLEFVSHNDLPNILWLQHLGTKLAKEVAADRHTDVGKLITCWTEGLMSNS